MPNKALAVASFLAGVTRKLGVDNHVYVVGGAVRNHLLGFPIKDVDLVVDSISAGKTSDQIALEMVRNIDGDVHVATNQYGVAILTMKSHIHHNGHDLIGETIEIANARKESYNKTIDAYKPTSVEPGTLLEDAARRDATVNTLMWRLSDLHEGVEKAPVIDLTGRGLTDLRNKILNTPMDPDRTFTDDPTRMLRMGKFAIKYELQLSKPVQEALFKNGHQLKSMPWEAVGTILVRDLLRPEMARDGLDFISGYSLIVHLIEMTHEQPPFAAYLARQIAAERHSVWVLLMLASPGMALEPKCLGFLTEQQHYRVGELVYSLGEEECRNFIDRLKKPNINSMALFGDFGIEGRDRGKLIPMAREILLETPNLTDGELDSALRERLRK